MRRPRRRRDRAPAEEVKRAMSNPIRSGQRSQLVLEVLLVAAMMAGALLALSVEVAIGLTPDEVLKLRAAGVSDETIQKMIDAQSAQPQGVPQSMVEQDYASHHIGTWNMPDGSVVLSTGKDRQPGFDPTLPQSNQYPINVYPYVFPGAGGMPGPPGPVVAPR
jgi:hypothetical protein